MSLASVTSRHTATKLNLTETRGDELGSNQVWAFTNTVFTCTIVPATGSESDQLKQRGAMMSHMAYFHADPELDERNCLRWDGVGNGTFFRVLSPARNAHGQNRLWMVPLLLLTHDQEPVTLAVV